MNYFEDTWLVGQFSTVLWNVFNQNAHIPRTNNDKEDDNINLKEELERLTQVFTK